MDWKHHKCGSNPHRRYWPDFSRSRYDRQYYDRHELYKAYHHSKMAYKTLKHMLRDRYRPYDRYRPLPPYLCQEESAHNFDSSEA
ncbi:hypothetical protein [Thermoflavimicrobium daqui]|uniref:hypothetical protein n=1 Tax=Thermoflavimicrobium daqui TaxID=2137476 RepID=UPI0011AB7114|nr:hypothetical protein [Thermoflavimicrobium daqui]